MARITERTYRRWSKRRGTNGGSGKDTSSLNSIKMIIRKKKVIWSFYLHRLMISGPLCWLCSCLVNIRHAGSIPSNTGHDRSLPPRMRSCRNLYAVCGRKHVAETRGQDVAWCWARCVVDRIWEWKGAYHKKINMVLRRMGVLYDWTHEALNMDANLSRAVTEIFCRYYDEGLIYRENRLVNWCTRL